MITSSAKISKAIFTEIRRLCLTSIETAIERLCEAGSWPRPPRARVMRIGFDFFGDDLRGIQEVYDLTELLASQDFIKTTYLRDQSDKYFLEDYWRRLVINILAETEGMTLSRPVFNKWFKRFLKELYTDTSLWREVNIIDGLVIHGKKLTLDQYSTLVPVPKSPWWWLERLVPKHDNCFNSYEFLRNNWEGPFSTEKTTLLVTTRRIPKVKYKGRHWSPNIEDIGRSSALIATIRLSKPGSPYLRASGFFQLSQLPLAEPLGYTLRDRFRLYEKEAIISEDDHRSIRALWLELISTEYGKPLYRRTKTNAMDIARGRFFSSYDTQNWFQDMLDLTIALEALFSPSDSQEISHRIALRCAWLLCVESSDPDHNKIYSCVRALYNLRSRIVHGSAPREREVAGWIADISGITYDPSRDWELRESAIESAREIVRRALEACYVLSKLPQSSHSPCWPLPKKFDQNIVLPSQQILWQKAAGVLK